MKSKIMTAAGAVRLVLLGALIACVASCGGDEGRPEPALELLSGNMGGPGNADGAVAVARFGGTPWGMALDADANLFVADTVSHTVRKITPSGLVSTIAGMADQAGSTDGNGAMARFNTPVGIASDRQGNVFVADSLNHTIRRITREGVVTTFAGSPGMTGSADGSGSAARFSGPSGLAIDAAGNIYVGDRGNHTIRMISSAGEVTTIAGVAGVQGSVDGPSPGATFSRPGGLAIDSVGNIFVADNGNSTIRKISAAGGVSTVAGAAGSSGYSDGTAGAARFMFPFGVSVDRAGQVYVTELLTCSVRVITSAGVVRTLAGGPGSCGTVDGTAAIAKLSGPAGIAVDTAGVVHVGDSFAVRRIDSSGTVKTLAGSVAVCGHDDGRGAAANFCGPKGLVGDAAGNIYVADGGNHTIRKITATGEVTTLAGKAGVAGTVDGVGTQATFQGPIALALDKAGNIYATDHNDDGDEYPVAIIRKITPGGTVTTLAGRPGTVGAVDGNATVASFGNPRGVVSDGAGNIYVADALNHTIRKITPEGVVSTLAGSPRVGGAVDGSGSNARFNRPEGLAIDGSGNLYVVDAGNSVIRKVTPAGGVSTLAGRAGVEGGSDGSGAAATFLRPVGIAVDGAGNAYVADSGNRVVRKIDANGTVTTFVGVKGVKGFSPGALPGVLSSPSGLTVVNGKLYITDANGVALVSNLP